MTATVEHGAETPAPAMTSAGGLFAKATSRRALIQVAIAVAMLVFVMFLLPPLTSNFWVKNFTSAAIYAIVAGATGMLYGRVGLVSLGQIALYGMSTWITMRLAFATDLPFPLLVLIAASITTVFGVIFGLPALRLGGLYLALVTLMVAASILFVLAQFRFPNGGGGFMGQLDEVTNQRQMRRPGIADGDVAFFRYALVGMVLMFLLALLHVTTKPGRAWASIRQSEAAALAAGVNVTRYKLWAWALSSFMVGVAGGLYAAFVKSPSTFTFGVQQNVTLMAVVVMGGVVTLWGGIVSGMLFAVLPELLEKWGMDANYGLILFGVGLTVNLLITSRQLNKAGVKE